MKMFSVPSPSSITVRLAWDANTESNVIGYRLYYSTTPGGALTFLADTGNVTSYQVSALTKRAYIWGITAYSLTKESSLSQSVTSKA